MAVPALLQGWLLEMLLLTAGGGFLVGMLSSAGTLMSALPQGRAAPDGAGRSSLRLGTSQAVPRENATATIAIVSTMSATSSPTTSTSAPSASAPQAPSTEWSRSCLRKTLGCNLLKSRDVCLRSRDWRATDVLEGKRIRGEPCAWCGGQPCDSRKPGVFCEPLDWVRSQPRSGLEVASCHELVAISPPSLFCFTLILPEGYEADLLRAQLSRRASLFGCDDFAVFSSRAFVLGTLGGTTQTVSALPAGIDLAVTYGGPWHNSLSSKIFLQLWRNVAELGMFQSHDWSIKVDPDTVFFPSRLRELLAAHEPMRSLARNLGSSCGRCARDAARNLTCPQHVRAMQVGGLSCKEALAKASEAGPEGCGCDCSDAACLVSTSSVYLNNCRRGMHGPIEVFSREAVAVLIEDPGGKCRDLKKDPWMEDEIMRWCLKRHGVPKSDQFSLLRERACRDANSFSCRLPRVAFHPLKTEQQYLACLSDAEDAMAWQWPR